MNKWSDEFVATPQDTARLSRLKKQLKKANKRFEDKAKRIFKGGDEYDNAY